LLQYKNRSHALIHSISTSFWIISISYKYLKSAPEERACQHCQHLQQHFVGHKQNLSKPDNRKKSTLTGHIWNLLDKNEEPEVNWEVVCKAAPFSPTTGIMQPMLSERWQIIFKPENTSLNRRQELFIYCSCKNRLLIFKNSRTLRKKGS
jgi:hypothetical protein